MDQPALDTTVDSVFTAQVSRYGSRLAFACEDVELTYAELDLSARRLAAWMVTNGVSPGDRVALWLPNGVTWVICYLATAHVGAVTVPVSTRLTAREASYIVDNANVRLLFAPAEFLGREYGTEAQTVVNNRMSKFTEAIVVNLEHLDLPAGERSTALPGSLPDTPAVVQYTSGTTGNPKGAVLTHRAWTNNARISALLAKLNEDDVVFSPSPFFHLFGSLTALMGSLSVGASLVTTPTYEPWLCGELVQRVRATHMVAVPTVWQDLLRPEHADTISGLTGGRWGGGAFSARALRHALSPEGLGLDLHAIYGMTEAPTLTQGVSTDPLWSKLETVGRPTPGIDVRIVDPESGDKMPPGSIGEIVTKGYCRALSYLGSPEEMTSRNTADGWLRTGDLGQLGDDGFLRVTGRLTDMVVSGGANIYAREVEDVILELDAVTLASVVPRSDERLGEVPVAWISVSSGRGHPDMEAAVLAHCRLRLASYKVPRRIFIVPELPLTASGKIHKARLVEMSQPPYGEVP